MSDQHHSVFDDSNFGLALGLAWGIGAMNAQNQANAEYNSIRQGYMAQGFTAPQATELTNQYFRPIWTRAAMVSARRRRTGWGWATGIWGFITLVAIVSPASDMSVGALVGTDLFFAAIVAVLYAVHRYYTVKAVQLAAHLAALQNAGLSCPPER